MLNSQKRVIFFFIISIIYYRHVTMASTGPGHASVFGTGSCPRVFLLGVVFPNQQKETTPVTYRRLLS